MPTVFEAQGVQQHTSTDTPMDKKHPEVKKHIHIGECPDTTHSEENSNAKVLGCNPMVILKSQDGTPKTCQPHKDLKVCTMHHRLSCTCMFGFRQIQLKRSRKR